MKAATVYLVGAGPGHAGLATLRAIECLKRADLVIYDRLAPAVLLDYASAQAEKVCVTELAACHAERHRPVQETMIERARRGQCVVRLKGGDPFLFGRGGEEAEALRHADVPFEIVPGVTAALGAASFAGIPLTHRRHASAVAFVTGHENPDKPESILDWSALARFPGTLVVYMGLSRLDKTAQTLIAHGMDPATPAAAIESATTGHQKTVEAPLSDLAAVVRASGITSPAVVIVGSVVSLRRELAWFETRPLFGKRVLITRPRRQASDMAERLLELGAVPLTLPAVNIREPADWAPVDAALAALASFHWLVFTSANGVHALIGRLLNTGRDLRALGSVKLAAIGPKTGDALRGYHLVPDLVPARYQSEDLAAALLEHIRPGECVLLARADRGREVLRDTLSGHCEVRQVAVYSQVDSVDPTDPVLDALRRGEIDFVTLTSSNIARAFLRNLDETARERIRGGRTRLVTISPVTSGDVRALGYEVAAEAKEATVEGMLEALASLT